MRSYEVIREIENSCGNNQMRDVFFDEIECESPVEYVRAQHAGKKIEITTDEKPDGSLIVYLTVDKLTQKYIFTEI